MHNNDNNRSLHIINHIVLVDNFISEFYSLKIITHLRSILTCKSVYLWKTCCVDVSFMLLSGTCRYANRHIPKLPLYVLFIFFLVYVSLSFFMLSLCFIFHFGLKTP